MQEIPNTNNLMIVEPKPRKDVLRKILWAAVSVMSIIFAFSSWAVTSPIGSSPDDDYHLASIWCGQGFRDELCEENADGSASEVPISIIS